MYAKNIKLGARQPHMRWKNHRHTLIKLERSTVFRQPPNFMVRTSFILFLQRALFAFTSFLDFCQKIKSMSYSSGSWSYTTKLADNLIILVDFFVILIHLFTYCRGIYTMDCPIK